MERRRSRHPHPEASQSGVREAAVAAEEVKITCDDLAAPFVVQAGEEVQAAQTPELALEYIRLFGGRSGPAVAKQLRLCKKHRRAIRQSRGISQTLWRRSERIDPTEVCSAGRSRCAAEARRRSVESNNAVGRYQRLPTGGLRGEPQYSCGDRVRLEIVLDL
jgi:hypothetical protein